MYFNKLKRAVIAGAVALGFGAAAHASVSVNVVDAFYGNFNGTIADEATGANDKLTWDSAIYGGGGDNSQRQIFIYFTNSSGLVQDIISNGPGSSTGYWDRLTFYGAQSGQAAIGATCAASSTIACITATGSPQELSGIFSSLNNGNGIFSGGTVTVTIGDAISGVPEPTGWALMLSGFGLVGAAMRRKRLAMRFA